MGLIVVLGSGVQLAGFWAAACLIEGRSLVDESFRLVLSAAIFVGVGIALLLQGASPAVFLGSLLAVLIGLSRVLLGAGWVAAFGGAALALVGGIFVVVHGILLTFYAQLL